jgi:uncharacterized membrane protein
MIKKKHSPFRLLVLSLVGLSGLSIALFGLGALRGNGWSDWYLIWNLFLAWIPMVLAYALVLHTRSKEWSSWLGIILTLVWMIFLPNSFYMVSDYIHLEDMARPSVLFDALTFTCFVFNGLVLGYVSLYMIQALLRNRVSRVYNELFVAAMLFLSSFAIYLGRDLRWNSWDVLVNPAGILFDVSERIIDPLGHPEAFSTTAVFFVFLAGLYWVMIHMVRAIGDYARSRQQWP